MVVNDKITTVFNTFCSSYRIKVQDGWLGVFYLMKRRYFGLNRWKKNGLFSTYYVDQDHRCTKLLICAHVSGADIIFEEKHAGAYHLFGGGVIHKTHFVFQIHIHETHVFTIKSKTLAHQIPAIIYHMTAVSSY